MGDTLLEQIRVCNDREQLVELLRKVPEADARKLFEDVLRPGWSDAWNAAELVWVCV
ncbi:hypothetical protein O4158_21425 [Gordonia amicalis]|uniref:hypothetical protein n=1 Tax=Gordonia amicalis TaxID=89053 RepID=UPI0022B565E3|nr:hypothetical protein [Gordonia amicalis]MCZ4581603.1 hypothetical protein [Gordonia amicalis]